MVLVLLTPVITRLYSTEAYGAFSVVVALAVTLMPAACLRLNVAVLLPKSRAESNALAAAGSLACLGLALLMAVTTSWITGMAAAATLYALAMVMVAMRIAPLQSLLTALVPGSRRGILMSLSVGIGQIGIAMGSAAAGFAYAGYGYASNTYIGAVAMVAMAALVHFALPEPDGDAAGVRLAGAPRGGRC